MVVGTRPKTYFDSETRMVRRASSQISRLCRFEQDPEKFTEGMLRALGELEKCK